MRKQSLQKKSDVLSASEIGQYSYCSLAWFLQRCGYEPESPYLDLGKQDHIALGNTLDGFEAQKRHARWLMILGLLVFCAAVVLLFFEVIL
jgi:hypothetical protein